jgi:nucleoside-diphosphate-sugar epimerase
VREVVSLMQKLVPFNAQYTGGKSGIQYRVLPIDKAKSLGYKPEVTLWDGLKATWNWFTEHRNEYEQRWNYFNGKLVIRS